jgi:hypothetical protein
MTVLSAQDKELLRLYLNDPAGASEVFTDVVLQRLYDDSGSLEACAAKGWRIKAATVYEWYLANIDGSFLSRDQVFSHCIKMAETFERSEGGSISQSIEVIMTGSANDSTSSSEF